MIQIDKYIVFC